MTYNTANLLSYYNGLTASDWNALAANIETNGLLAALQANFTINGRYATALNAVPSHTQKAFADGCRHCADAVTNSWAIDFSGVSISDSVTSSNWQSAITLHIDIIIVYTGGLPAFAVSFWHSQSQQNS